MGVSTGANIITNGLILNLDIANRKSRLPDSLVNTADWATGTGGTATYGTNGSVASESTRKVVVDPWGYNNVAWECSTTGTNNNDGGLYTPTVAIDKTKMYRFSLWVRRTSASASGTWYFGTGGDTVMVDLNRNLGEGNPYFNYIGTAGLPQNQWYLFVGFIYPYTYQGRTRHPDSGSYQVATGNRVDKTYAGSGNFLDGKFVSTSGTVFLRTFLYYATDTTTTLEIMYPRIDLCDGTEPTISELLKDPYVIYDTSGYGNDHTIINTGTNPYYNPFTLNPKKFTFNDTQSIQRIGALNGVTNACTVVMFYSTTDTTELWCMGSSNASWYLGASSGNSYYHSNCGNPTYWVDLKSTINPWSEGYRNGNFHMWEAKNVDFSAWTAFDWFGYPGVWRLTGNVAAILVYNRALTAAESAYNYTALRAKYGI